MGGQGGPWAGGQAQGARPRCRPGWGRGPGGGRPLAGRWLRRGGRKRASLIEKGRSCQIDGGKGWAGMGGPFAREGRPWGWPSSSREGRAGGQGQGGAKQGPSLRSLSVYTAIAYSRVFVNLPQLSPHPPGAGFEPGGTLTDPKNGFCALPGGSGGHGPDAPAVISNTAQGRYSSPNDSRACRRSRGGGADRPARVRSVSTSYGTNGA